MSPQFVLLPDERDQILSAARNIMSRTPADGYEHNIVLHEAQRIVEILDPDEVT